MIKVPDHGRLTLVRAFELLGELDWYAGSRAGSNANPVGAIERTREALRRHVAESLTRKDKRGAR